MPGSMSVPFGSLLNADTKTLLPPSQLASTVYYTLCAVTVVKHGHKKLDFECKNNGSTPRLRHTFTWMLVHVVESSSHCLEGSQ